MRKKIRIGLIFGGRSGEHEVSLLSAQSVMGAIDRDKYEIVPIGITKEGRWLAGGRSNEGPHQERQPRATPLPCWPSHAARADAPEDQEKEQALKAIQVSQIDVAFPILHGPYGEDGTVQAL